VKKVSNIEKCPFCEGSKEDDNCIFMVGESEEKNEKIRCCCEILADKNVKSI
jgi:hypothetical protein